MSEKPTSSQSPKIQRLNSELDTLRQQKEILARAVSEGKESEQPGFEEALRGVKRKIALLEGKLHRLLKN